MSLSVFYGSFEGSLFIADLSTVKFEPDKRGILLLSLNLTLSSSNPCISQFKLNFELNIFRFKPVTVKFQLGIFRFKLHNYLVLLRQTEGYNVTTVAK